MAPIVRQINELEKEFQSFSDDDLRGLTASWKEDLAKLPTLEEQWKRLDEILPEAFAVVKNAARRLTERGHIFTVCAVRDDGLARAMARHDRGCR